MLKYLTIAARLNVPQKMWLVAFTAVFTLMPGWGNLALAQPPAVPHDFSGWRGGIGFTSGPPSHAIADVTEMGYDFQWGGEDPHANKALGISVFRYWNSVIEISLKGSGYDFSEMLDKDEAARLAVDAWMEQTYGVKGLSKHVSVRYNPKGPYGDVTGSMDLSSENDLVKAVIANYMQSFEKSSITHGGIGLDNAGKVPREFLEILKRQLNARGLGIAANGCPEQFLSFIDFFGNEGFPFNIDRARQLQAKGLRGILGEFTTQHLSGGEMDAYLKNKLFNGVVFFGFTNGGAGAGAIYSVYCSRPDVYHHHRWTLRRVIPVSRAVQRAGRQSDPGAQLSANTSSVNRNRPASTGALVRADGRVIELKRGVAGLDVITGRLSSTPPAIIRYGRDIANGLFLFVDSGNPEEVVCDGQKLGVRADTLVFDEFSGRVLDARRGAGSLIFKTSEGPSVVQLASAATLSKSQLERIAESLHAQLAQRELDRELSIHYPRKAWSRFCQAGRWDATVAHNGKGSLAVAGGIYTGSTAQWKYSNRQGAAQLVTLNQTEPTPIDLRAFSKSNDVTSSENISLNTIAARRSHFDARDGHLYCMHLYLDYQDGQWPEVHTVAFSAGTHDWEQKNIRVEPTRPVKTAMVLLEFHQPEGTAWFDDVSLTTGGSAEQNLLAVGGFEDGDEASNEAWAISAHYEDQLRSLINSVETTAQSTNPLDAIEALERQVDTLVNSVTGKSLASYFPRELRDLDDAKDRLKLCVRLLKTKE